jgi:VCBS repeat-containing protein
MTASCLISAQAAVGLPARLSAVVPGDSCESAGDLTLLAHDALTDAVSDLAASVPAQLELSTAELLPELDRIAADLNAASGVGEFAAVQQYMHFELYLNQPAPVDTPVQLALGDGDAFGAPAYLGRPEVSFNGGLSWQSMPELVLPAGTTTARVRLALMAERLFDGEECHPVTTTLAAGPAANTIGRPADKPPYADQEQSIVGQLVRTEADAGAAFQRQDQVSGCYGRFSADADGAWSYHLDHAVPEVRALLSGQSLTECFDARSVDGTPHDLLITIRGGDDALLIYGVEISLPVLSH